MRQVWLALMRDNTPVVRYWYTQEAAEGFIKRTGRTDLKVIPLAPAAAYNPDPEEL